MWVNYLIKALAFEGQRKPISLGTVRRLRYTENDRTFNTAGIYTDEFGKLVLR
jgi:hypothetical protein